MQWVVMVLLFGASHAKLLIARVRVRVIARDGGDTSHGGAGSG